MAKDKIASSGTRSNDAENEPLHVLIIGAGIGGLTAGLALRQQGHDVTIFESSRFSNETGAAIHVTPNCNGLLRRMGLYLEDVRANEMTGINMYAPTGHCLNRIDLRQSNQIWQHPWLLVHRAHLHTALRERATRQGGAGRPCELRLASKVVAVDSSAAEVTLESGERVLGDVVLGADGVHSQCRKYLKGDDNFEPFDCGHSAFRFLVPVQDLKDDPVTAALCGDPGRLTMNIAADRRIVYYPCNENTLMNFLLIHPSAESRAEEGDWNQKGDKKRMLEIAGPFADSFKALLKKAPEDTLKVWTLLDMDVLPSWVNGRLALLGDAAHPFLPHSAQGGAQAIEDAVSLAAILPLGTRKKDLPERLRLYETCRRERANRIQELTRQAGMSLQEQEKRGIKYNPQSFNAYNFDHDEWDHSDYALKRHIWSKVPHRWRQTLSFGPSPGPRQPLNQVSDSVSYARQHQIQYSIRFKTSKTYLQNMFPTSQFSFATPGTFAQASIMCASLQNMVWLGDTGYHHCGLYIHGVKYTKRNGEEIFGTFLPVLFENLADPICTGREELGAPKWFSDIDIGTPSTSSTKITMGWRGTVFGELNFDNLVATDRIPDSERVEVVPKPSPDVGILMYRYIPAVGQPGVADAEYAILDRYDSTPKTKDSKPAESTFIEVQRRKFGFETASDSRRASSASIKFEAKGWPKLPTINHIADGLAQMPIYEILEAKADFLPSVYDVRGASRIEKA